MVLNRPSELEMSGRDNRFNGREVNSNHLCFSRIDIKDFIMWRSYNTLPVTFAENSQVECKKHFIFDEIPETNIAPENGRLEAGAIAVRFREGTVCLSRLTL